MRIIWTSSSESGTMVASYNEGTFCLGFDGPVDAIRLTARDAERLASAIRREHPYKIIDNGDMIDFGNSWGLLTKERVAEAQNELAAEVDDLQAEVASLRQSVKHLLAWADALEKKAPWRPPPFRRGGPAGR